MSLYQQTIIEKYLQSVNHEKIHSAFQFFSSTFLNPVIQENIRNSKEEQYQEGFLRDLFVQVLGYRLNPTEDYNLTTEYKNVKDSKKADGAILINGMVKAIIELKGTETTDLNKIEPQAFGYKNNQPECNYVVISNFEKLRFYIDNAVEHLEFNLFTLDEEQFEMLYICLAYENIAFDLPKKLKEASVSEEDRITKELYKDYSQFKQSLFRNMVEKNPEYEELELFKKSQKLLDRFLFIFFAEDRSLLPPNSMRKILQQWIQLKELDAYDPLYNRFRKYFGYMNTGFKGKSDDVFAYNGGLFKPDDLLDSITIDDDILYDHTLKLSQYDYASEVDVNILGHIFEHSLNEIEEIKAQVEGKSVDKSKTKRKKDGVYYTPKYITRYIVENTVGKLCEEKRKELGIVEEEYLEDRKRNKATKKPLLDKLEAYREWLLRITICDPACGSGAFLNQALDFLISEHRYIDELKAKISGFDLMFEDVESSILENNLFGVDLNEESVEIAKLSLWLRTARQKRKLNSLTNNIKCGNSLIDDTAIAGDKAFNWEKEFPHVFAKGGFDVVIGNPPYVLCQPSNTESITLHYYKTFQVASYKIDLFHLFFERGIQILRKNGKIGFITPNTYLTNKYIKKLRQFILNNTTINQIVNYSEVVFVDAGVDVCTIILTKEEKEGNHIEIFESLNGTIELTTVTVQNDWRNNVDFIFNIKNKFTVNFNNCVFINDIGKTYFGIQAYDRNSSISNKKIETSYLPMVDGADIQRYTYAKPMIYFNYIPGNIKSGGEWGVYKLDRIVIRQIGKTPIIGMCPHDILTSNTIYNLYITNENFNLKYVLSILNSRLIKEFWLANFDDNKALFPKIKGYQLKQLPIKNIPPIEQEPYIEKADRMLSLNEKVREQSKKFLRSLTRHFGIEKFPAKVENWYELSYEQFLTELKKMKITLSLSREAEWEDFFQTAQQEMQTIQSQIDQTDREIDQMVYHLYGLTEEEIAIVENN